MQRIVFWFDPVSPFAWLAFEALPQALEGVSVAVEYRPVVFGAMLAHWGTVGPAEVEPKRAWTFRHCHWLAQRQGLAMATPAVHPFNSLALSRLLLAAAGEGPTALPGRRQVERVLRHVWQGEGADALDPARLAALRTALAPVRDPAGEAVKAQLRALTDEALALGVFGVPSIGVQALAGPCAAGDAPAPPDSQLPDAGGAWRVLWGLDALPMLRAELTGQGRLDDAAWQREGAARPGVQRSRRGAG